MRWVRTDYHSPLLGHFVRPMKVAYRLSTSLGIHTISRIKKKNVGKRTSEKERRDGVTLKSRRFIPVFTVIKLIRSVHLSDVFLIAAKNFKYDAHIVRMNCDHSSRLTEHYVDCNSA